MNTQEWTHAPLSLSLSQDQNHVTQLKAMKSFCQRISLSASGHCTLKRRTTTTTVTETAAAASKRLLQLQKQTNITVTETTTPSSAKSRSRTTTNDNDNIYVVTIIMRASLKYFSTTQVTKISYLPVTVLYVYRLVRIIFRSPAH